jgi:hypothetical protein
LSAGWIFNLHLPQSSSATAGRLGLPLRTLRAMIRPRIGGRYSSCRLGLWPSGGGS